MSFKGGEFSTGTTGNFQPELTLLLAGLKTRGHMECPGGHQKPLHQKEQSGSGRPQKAVPTKKTQEPRRSGGVWGKARLLGDGDSVEVAAVGGAGEGVGVGIEGGLCPSGGDFQSGQSA